MPRNHIFNFKEFSINQEKCAMKVCTDAVFFGSVIDVFDSKNILDIGTGTGLLALMVAQRCNADIVGIDIDQDAVLQAKENVLNSKFKNRIQIVESAVQNFKADGFDHIISNPPFFQNSLLSNKKQVNLAHHAETLNLNELLDAVARLLNSDGKFDVLLPPFEFDIFEKLAGKIGLFLDSKLELKIVDSKPIFRIIGTFRFQKTSELKVRQYLIYESDLRTYTSDFKELIQDFYL